MEENESSVMPLVGSIVAGVMVLIVILLISLTLLFMFVVLPGASGESHSDGDSAAEILPESAAPDAPTAVPSGG